MQMNDYFISLKLKRKKDQKKQTNKQTNKQTKTKTTTKPNSPTSPHPQITHPHQLIDIQNTGRDKNNILTNLIQNLKTAWPTKMLMQFLSSLDNLL